MIPVFRHIYAMSSSLYNFRDRRRSKEKVTAMLVFINANLQCVYIERFNAVSFHILFERMDGKCGWFQLADSEIITQ